MPGRRSAATLLAREPTKVRTAFAYAVSPVRWWGRIAAMRPDPSRRTDERGNLSSRWRPADVLTLILGVVFGGFEGSADFLGVCPFSYAVDLANEFLGICVELMDEALGLE